MWIKVIYVSENKAFKYLNCGLSSFMLRIAKENIAGSTVAATHRKL